MPLMEIGTRVMAIQSANESAVYLFGRGVYVGDHIPESGMLHLLKVPNPKIQLDNGSTVYGYQCWWGPEEAMEKKFAGRQMIDVEVSHED